MTRTKIAAALITLLLFAAPALAQQKAGPNGGMVGGSGTHQTELVLTGAEATVYLLHDGKVSPTKGVTVRIVVQDGGATSTVSLSDAGGKLVGKLAGPMGKGAIVVVSGKDDHDHAISSRYVID